MRFTRELKQEHLLPSQHLLDSGSVNAQTLASSQHDYGVEMGGPARADCQWQAHAEAV
jgi:transposase